MYIDRFMQVIELYELHENSMMRRKKSIIWKAGMASFHLMDDIQGQPGVDFVAAPNKAIEMHSIIYVITL